MPKLTPETGIAWVPTAQQAEVIDLLATGYSQQATSRALDVPVTTISYWIHEAAFADTFREQVDLRAAEFNAAKEAVHDQQVVMALQILQDALSGELQREADFVLSDDGKATRTNNGGKAPLRYEAAVELLRATFWKQVAGGHKAFGAP